MVYAAVFSDAILSQLQDEMPADVLPNSCWQLNRHAAGTVFAAKHHCGTFAVSVALRCSHKAAIRFYQPSRRVRAPCKSSKRGHLHKGARKGVQVSGPCSIRVQIDGQKAREMQAWSLTQPGGSKRFHQARDFTQCWCHQVRFWLRLRMRK